MILPYPKVWVCLDCKHEFEKLAPTLNPLNRMDTWKPKCPECGSKSVLSKSVPGVCYANKNFFS